MRRASADPCEGHDTFQASDLRSRKTKLKPNEPIHAWHTCHAMSERPARVDARFGETFCCQDTSTGGVLLRLRAVMDM